MGREGPEMGGSLMLILVSTIALFLNTLFPACGAAALPSNPDAHTLQLFRATADPTLQHLNWSAGDPCTSRWIGVSCSEGGRVYELVLEGLNLTGHISALSSLGQLRLLSLKNNALNGSLPDMTQWRYLRHLYLHNNQFSGPIPESVEALPRLLRFTASNNRLSGPIPPGITKLTHLATLRLEANQLSGLIPPLQLVNLGDFNVSNNQLVGSIPLSLDKFGASAFQGNPMLCGRPLFPGMLCDSAVPKTVPSTQSARPGENAVKKKSRLSTGSIIAIVVGDAAAVLIAVLFLAYYWQRNSHGRHANEKPAKKADDNVNIALSQCTPIKLPDSERCKLVFFEGGSHHLFALDDLLRASAVMLGKGSFGTAYKAVLEDGTVVAVKRLKEVSASSRKEFDQKMEVVGKLRHPNVLPLRAYYYAKEEKLLVYDFQRNGSLYSHLHDRGPGRSPLGWVTRLKIAVGVAKALTHLHHECGAQKVPHGNIKSSNILLDENYNPLVADFGLAMIMNPVAAPSRMAGYRAPEQADSKRISQRADVYSFGVMLLELLTGKAPAPVHPSEDGIDLPRWVHSVVREEWTAEVFDIELLRYKNIEEDMVSMLQTAMLCIVPVPERRPQINEVLPLLQKLCADQSPLDSIPQSPSVSEDAGHSAS